MNKDDIINARLQSDYQYLTQCGYDVLGVFLQGSQNYGLDYNGSDIDTKAIVLPSIDDIIFNKKPVSTTHIFDNNEHLDIKDIRLMHECFHKQNINFIEILFTKWKVLNPYYEDAYSDMFKNNELIAHYNLLASLACMYGMMNEKYKALKHPYPTIKPRIDAYGYDPKQLHHIIRLEEFMRHYIDNHTYDYCLHNGFDDKLNKLLIQIKKLPPPYSVQQAESVAIASLGSAKLMYDTFKDEHASYQPNSLAHQIMNNCLSAVLKLSLKKQI